jgi:hypothetical protein
MTHTTRVADYPVSQAAIVFVRKATATCVARVFYVCVLASALIGQAVADEDTLSGPSHQPVG